MIFLCFIKFARDSFHATTISGRFIGECRYENFETFENLLGRFQIKLLSDLTEILFRFYTKTPGKVSKRNILRSRLHHSSHDNCTNEEFCEPIARALWLLPARWIAINRYTRGRLKFAHSQADHRTHFTKRVHFRELFRTKESRGKEDRRFRILCFAHEGANFGSSSNPVVRQFGSCIGAFCWRYRHLIHRSLIHKRIRNSPGRSEGVGWRRRYQRSNSGDESEGI